MQFKVLKAILIGFFIYSFNQVVFSQEVSNDLERARTLADEGKLDEALSLFKEAANKGDVEAMRIVGLCYLGYKAMPLVEQRTNEVKENKISENFKEAAKWLSLAADREDGIAQLELGRLYLFGKGVSRSGSLAIKYIQKAADQNIPEACNLLGELYADGTYIPKDEFEAFRWFDKAGQLNYGRSYYNLGRLYLRDESPSPSDLSKAVKYLKQAVDYYEVDAMLVLARLYSEGKGVPLAMDMAIELLERASRLGNAEATRMLGNFYFNGVYVEHNPKYATRLYENAAKAGDIYSYIWLGRLYFGEEGLEYLNPKKSFDMFYAAGEMGSAYGMLRVASAYVNGVGADVNLWEAIRWFEKAKKAGEGAMSDDFLNYINGRLADLSRKAETNPRPAGLMDAVMNDGFFRLNITLK